MHVSAGWPKLVEPTCAYVELRTDHVEEGAIYFCFRVEPPVPSVQLDISRLTIFLDGAYVAPPQDAVCTR